MRAENNVIKRGAIKNIAEHSAIGIDTSPRKKIGLLILKEIL